MRILLIRPGALGDTLLTFPVIQALKISYPAARMTLVGNATVLPLALAWGVVDTVADYEDPLWGQIFRSIRSTEDHQPVCEMTKKQLALHHLLRQYDRVICWLRDPEGLVERNLRLAGVKHITIAAGRPPAELSKQHVVDYLAATVGLTGVEPRKLWPNARFEQVKTQSNSTQHPRYTVAIHPGSGGAHKCWPVTRFVQVITALWQRGSAVLLLAGPADHERLAVLRSQLPSPPQAALWHELVDAPLLTVVRQLQDCTCYLGNDAGVTHLAALSGLPTVVLFGASDPLVWQPVGPSVTVLQATSLEDITTRQVLAALDTCMAHF